MGWNLGKDGEAGNQPGSRSAVPGNQPADGSAAPRSVDAAPRDARLAGFAHGGEWDSRAPGPELAAVLGAVAGPEWRCPGADPDELTGVLRRLAALESWAAAAKLGVIREMIRQDDVPLLGRPRHGDLPDAWSDSLKHELALALATTVPTAEKTALTAWELGARLPGIAAGLADGTLTYSKARLIAEAFQWLSDDNAARAEQLILPQLTSAAKTYGQLLNLAARIASEVDPGLAERRRKAAVKHASRVRMFREDSGAAALSGRDLPADETLAAYASVTARATEYQESGVFPDARMDQLRSTAYLDLINGVPAAARIAYGYLSTDDPAPKAASAAGPGPGPDDDDPGSGGTGRTGGNPGGPRPPENSGPGDRGSGDDSGTDDKTEPGDSGGLGDEDHRDQPEVGHPVLADLNLPLATLLGLADRPGESHGLGVLDPDLCRRLAALAAVSPHTQLCVTVTNPDGIAVGHGCAKLSRQSGPVAGTPPGPAPPHAPPLVPLPARLNLTITAARLAALPGGPGPDWHGPWTFTLPGGRELTVSVDPVPTYACDHRNESHAYQPNARLRHLVQVRDYACTFPSCSRQARESDFEHAQPYDKGGRTCACNAGARSRKCHRVKQSPGWNVTQPAPGWHQWTTPSGRTYTQGPYRYPV